MILTKVKVAFNNVRSLNKHFKDIEHEPNVLAADVIGFAESRLCARDQRVYFALRRFIVLRSDDTGYGSLNRPHHMAWPRFVYEIIFGSAETSEIAMPVQCEFIFAALHSGQKGYFQVVILYKYPKTS